MRSTSSAPPASERSAASRVRAPLVSLLAWIGVGLLGACTESPSLSDEERDAIAVDVRGAFDRLADAAVALDHDLYLGHFDRDRFTALLEGEVVASFDEFETAYREGTAAIESYVDLDFDPIRVTVLDRNAAILVNGFSETLALTSGDTLALEGGGTQVWNRTADGWRLVHVAGSTRPAR